MIQTERLTLRRWRDDDRAEFHRQCSDARVMQYLGGVQTRAQTDAALDRHDGYTDSHGYGFWAVERRGDAALLGFCGLKPGPCATPIEGKVEIGWRFGVEYWGQGYALEAARASLAWGWANLTEDSIWAITVPANTRSWRLMDKLGMQHREDLAFDHPSLAEDDPLRPHITYAHARPAA